MSTPSRSELTKQFNRVKQWLPDIEAAGKPYGFPASLLLAIGSRETNFDPKYQRVPGDGGHGFSWWQIDKRSYPRFTSSGDWKDPAKAVRKAAQVLNEKRDEVLELDHAEKSTDAILRVAIAAYNCGSVAAYRNLVNHGDPDRGTTGKDYSADVLAREKVFAELVSRPTSLPPVAAPQPLPVTVTAPDDDDGNGSDAEPTVKPVTNEVVVPPAVAADSGSKKSFWAVVLGLPSLALTYITQNIGEAFGWLKDKELLKWVLIIGGAILAIYLLRQIVMSVVKQVSAAIFTLQSMKYHADPASNNVVVGQPAPAKPVEET